VGGRRGRQGLELAHPGLLCTATLRATCAGHPASPPQPPPPTAPTSPLFTPPTHTPSPPHPRRYAALQSATMEFGNGFVGAVHDNSRSFIYASIAAIELAMLDKHPTHDLSWKNDIKLPPNACGCVFMIDLNQRASTKDPNSALMKALVCGTQTGEGTCDNDGIAHPGGWVGGWVGAARAAGAATASGGGLHTPLPPPALSGALLLGQPRQQAQQRPHARPGPPPPCNRRHAGVRRVQRPAAHLRAGRARAPGGCRAWMLARHTTPCRLAAAAAILA
jgi:hypothetical protein